MHRVVWILTGVGEFSRCLGSSVGSNFTFHCWNPSSRSRSASNFRFIRDSAQPPTFGPERLSDARSTKKRIHSIAGGTADPRQGLLQIARITVHFEVNKDSTKSTISFTRWFSAVFEDVYLNTYFKMHFLNNYLRKLQKSHCSCIANHITTDSSSKTS